MAQEQTCLFNVGGCLYSIPMSRLACFQESLLLKEIVTNDNARLFLDRDGFTFRHLHYYIHTGKLASSCISELNILYELASTLRLTSLQQVSRLTMLMSNLIRLLDFLASYIYQWPQNHSKVSIHRIIE